MATIDLQSSRPYALCFLALLLGCHAFTPRIPPTPLEAQSYEAVSSAAAISAYLDALGQRDARAAHVVIGRSAGGYPLDALLVGKDVGPLLGGAPPSGRLRVMILGSQHGTEASGAEAILILARQLLRGQEQLLDEMEFVLLPLANPDGREARRRVNANGVNLSTDFTILSEPESRALVDALARWQPDVFLDVHESAVFKRQSLAAQGYMTDVEAQFEVGNNPNIDAAIASFSRKQLRPQILLQVSAAGLEAQDYLGEITDIGQPITHGGVTIRNLRNRAAMNGVFSFLVENRLDPPHGTYPTPRNIRARTEKQLLSVEAFLAVCQAEREAIRERTRVARGAWTDASAKERETLFVAYAVEPERPEIAVRLRRIADGQTEKRIFAYHGRIEVRHEIALPAAYAVTQHTEAIRELLDRQHIRYEILPAPRRCPVTASRVRTRRAVAGRHGWGYLQTDIEEYETERSIPAETLWVPLRQPTRRLIPLLLELRSNSSLFEHPDYAPLVVTGQDFFIYRVTGDCEEAKAAG